MNEQGNEDTKLMGHCGDPPSVLVTVLVFPYQPSPLKPLILPSPHNFTLVTVTRQGDLLLHRQSRSPLEVMSSPSQHVLQLHSVLWDLFPGTVGDEALPLPGWLYLCILCCKCEDLAASSSSLRLSLHSILSIQISICSCLSQCPPFLCSPG